MQQEIELKLLAPSDAGGIIEQQVLGHLSGSYSKRVVELSNHYFDTPNRDLRKLDAGLRIRTKGQYCEQTLKTAGTSIGGLHQRPEYNVELSMDAKHMPNLALFPESAWPKQADVASLQQQLTTLFATDFTRTIYLLELRSDCQIEMVWDVGQVSAKGGSKPICEIELELVKGQPSDLFDVAEQLLSHMYLALGADSKAARGYRLADNISYAGPSLITVDASQLATSGYQDCVTWLENALASFQYCCHSLSHGFSRQLAKRLIAALGQLQLLLGAHSFEGEFNAIAEQVERLVAQTAAFTEQIDELSDDDGLRQVQQLFLQPHVTLLQLNILRALLDSRGRRTQN